MSFQNCMVHSIKKMGEGIGIIYKNWTPLKTLILYLGWLVDFLIYIHLDECPTKRKRLNQKQDLVHK